MTLSPGGVQEMQAIFPRQAVLTAQLGRSAGNAGAHSQAGSVNTPQLGRSAGSAGALSQAGNINPSAGKECRHSFPGRPESQSQPRCLWCYSGDASSFPWQYIRYHWGTRGRGFILKFLSDNFSNVYFSFMNLI